MDLNFAKLDDSKVALESFVDDLRHVVQDGRGEDPMEVAIAERRWNNLAAQHGLEGYDNYDDAVNADDRWAKVGRAAVNGLVGVAGVAKKAVIASAHHFGNFVESMQIYFDKSGGKEVDRLRRLLEETQGDAEGIVTNPKLATALSVNGRVPTDFTESVTRLTGLVDLLEKAVPALAKVNSEAAKGTPANVVPKTEKEIENFFRASIQAIVHGGNPLHHFPSAVLTEQFLGGQRLFVEKTHPPMPKQKTDPTLAKVLAVTSQLKYAVATSKPAQEAINPRLPILSRDQIKSMIELCEKLTDDLHRLLALAKNHAKDPTGLDVLVNVDRMVDELSKAGAGDLRVEAHVQAGWIEPYYRSDITNQQRLIEAGMRIVGTAHKAFAEYAHVSLKHFK